MHRQYMFNRFISDANCAKRKQISPQTQTGCSIGVTAYTLLLIHIVHISGFSYKHLGTKCDCKHTTRDRTTIKQMEGIYVCPICVSWLSY